MQRDVAKWRPSKSCQTMIAQRALISSEAKPNQYARGKGGLDGRARRGVSVGMGWSDRIPGVDIVGGQSQSARKVGKRVRRPVMRWPFSWCVLVLLHCSPLKTYSRSR